MNISDKARRTALRVGSAAKQVASHAAPVAKQTASHVGSAAKQVASHAAPVAKQFAHEAATRTKQTVYRVAREAALKNAAGMRTADARPHTVRNRRTGQDVVVEAYVKSADGKRDYDAVFPKGAMGDFGQYGNKIVGMLLVMAGIPMLILPGPGTAAIAAGFYYLSK